eukprot:12913015-Prorocentrum_lima.AAC.1
MERKSIRLAPSRRERDDSPSDGTVRTGRGDTCHATPRNNALTWYRRAPQHICHDIQRPRPGLQTVQHTQ